MLQSDDLFISRRFLLVDLVGWGGLSVTLAIDLTNVYVVAYLAGSNRSFFLQETDPEARSYLFRDTNQIPLPFSGSYPDLESQAGSRRNIDLGVNELGNAVQGLYYSNNNPTQARSLIVAIQMVSEAVRFNSIANRVISSIPGTFRPDAFMLDLETSWGQLSTAVQESNGGALARNFNIAGELQLDNVRWVLPILSLLLVCREDNNNIVHPSPFLKISSVVDVGGDDVECAIPEPTIRITGRDGLCADIRDGNYNDGTPIQLFSCKSNTDPNQLWTLRKNGSITSNGKCMTANRYSRAVSIFNCDGATLWQVKDDGTIVDRGSGLALTAQSGSSGSALTTETDVSASRQCWLATNITKPLVVTIIGLNDLCMEASGTGMWLERCDSAKGEQRWTIYGDGTIRPNQNLQSCLTPVMDSSIERDVISITSCSAGSSGQHWIFTNDGTILNPGTQRLMDVRASNPWLRQIILWTPTGNPNQSWRLSL